MVNIWLVFVPGAAATTIEKIIREASTHKTMPPAYREFDTSRTDLYAVPAKGAMNSHLLLKQWHPCEKEKLTTEKSKCETYPVNIFTPIAPMPDWKGKSILEYISSIKTDNDYLFYLGPNSDSIDFQRCANQKAPNDPMTGKETKDTIWEEREHWSQTIMQWYVPEMSEQWETANKLGYICYDTEEIFSNLNKVIFDILYRTNGAIRDEEKFFNLCDEWSSNQYAIWDMHDRLTKYKKTIQGVELHDVSLNGDMMLESMIQYYLREQGTELLCYGLDDFPSSANIKEYYDI